MKASPVSVAARWARLRFALLLGATFALGSAAPAQAPLTNAPVGVEKMADFRYRVWVSNPAAQPGRLQLVDAGTGAVLYNELNSQVSFGQRFNVRNLPDGRYALSLRTTAQRSAELTAEAVPAAGRRVAGL